MSKIFSKLFGWFLFLISGGNAKLLNMLLDDEEKPIRCSGDPMNCERNDGYGCECSSEVIKR